MVTNRRRWYPEEKHIIVIDCFETRWGCAVSSIPLCRLAMTGILGHSSTRHPDP